MVKRPGLYSPMHLGDVSKIYRDIFNSTGKAKQNAEEKLKHFDYVCSSFPRDSSEAAYMNKYRLIASNLAKSMNEIDDNYDVLKHNLENEFNQKTDKLMNRSTFSEAFDMIRDVAVGVIGYGGAKILGNYIDMDFIEGAETHIPYVAGITMGWLSNKIEKTYKSVARKKMTTKFKKNSDIIECERRDRKNEKYSREINKLVYIYGQTSQIESGEKELLDKLYNIKLEFNSH